MNISSIAFDRDRRCQKKVDSTGTNYFMEDSQRCARLARYTIDNKDLCAQHAGMETLLYVVNLQSLKELSK